MILTTIFYEVDNFCKTLNQDCCALENNRHVKKHPGGRPRKISLSEILTICIFYHHSGYKNFKYYYLWLICTHLRTAFKSLPSYNRFVELMREALIPCMIFCLAHTGKITGISYVDSTPLAVCKNQRIYSHKVFKKVAKRGKSSTGWFYGFKLHLVINHMGEIIAFAITPGNVDDRNLNVMRKLTKNLFGKLFGDRGYLSQKLFEQLMEKGIHLITRVKKNMKKKPMSPIDNMLLDKRGIVESVNNVLKNVQDLEHSRHRSIAGFFVNIASTIAAYFFYINKSTKLHTELLPAC